jgi:hypothetical protein
MIFVVVAGRCVRRYSGSRINTLPSAPHVTTRLFGYHQGPGLLFSFKQRSPCPLYSPRLSPYLTPCLSSKIVKACLLQELDVFSYEEDLIICPPFLSSHYALTICHFLSSKRSLKDLVFVSMYWRASVLVLSCCCFSSVDIA